MDTEMFESEFAKVEYIAADNVVFHIWKKELTLMIVAGL